MKYLSEREALFVTSTIEAMNKITEDRIARIKELEEENKQLLEALESARELMGNNASVLNTSDNRTGDVWIKVNKALNSAGK